MSGEVGNMKRVLVVEDLDIYTAREALHDGEYTFVFAETYEQAKILLDEGVDGIITDLFFPSDTDWTHYWAIKILTSPIYQAVDEEQQTNLLEISIATENPSGLAIIKECIERKIPFVMVTAGNRHHGNLAKVRHSLPCLQPFALHDQLGWKDKVYNDPLPIDITLQNRTEIWYN